MYVNVNDHLTVDSLYTNRRKDYLMKINIRHMTNVINNQAQMINDRPRTSVLQEVNGKKGVVKPSIERRARSSPCSNRRERRTGSMIGSEVAGNRTSASSCPDRIAPERRRKSRQKDNDRRFKYLFVQFVLVKQRKGKRPAGSSMRDTHCLINERTHTVRRRSGEMNR